MNGKAVQLKQGKEFVLQSERHPLDLAREFNRYGEIAVIDLDAATGKGDNRELIKQICRIADVRVGGGIRNEEIGRDLLKAGAQTLIIGTQATPEFLCKFPRDKVMVALDHLKGQVVDSGWQRDTGESLRDRAERLKDYCSGFLVTFVANEGGLGGMKLENVKEVVSRLDNPVTVAGGIANTDEIITISQHGFDVQVGMALYTGKIDLAAAIVGCIKFDGAGLSPTIVQDEHGQNLMMAYSSPESLRQALQTGQGVYFSRSRQQIWVKGLTSGNTQQLLSCRVDCDRDCLLFTVRQTNAACHRQLYSCFGQATAARKFSLPQLFELLKERKREMPTGSYSATLFKDRRKLLKKLMEEAYETVTFNSRDNLKWEMADVLYFMSVLAVDEGIEWEEIEAELGGRYR
jgi:phosphoribosyl-AMP cyclohydrolase / phosphoribosyl-ATP pyrophosphohydrolase